MRITATTDVGKVRPNNEDNFVYGQLNNALYAVVCDGMGGVSGGEIASRMAVETIRQQIENAYSSKMKAGAIERMLISALTAANYKVYEYALSNDMQGMGTTVVVALVKDDMLFIAYDGDSRAYIIGDGIRQVTIDHTYVNELYRIGELTKEQLESDPRKNIITRAIGVAQDIDVEVMCEDLETDELVLLCTDGLTNCLTDSQILEICHTQPFEKMADVLIEKANENGGVDNITAALIWNKEEE